MLQAARDAGIEPWVCLHHFTLAALVRRRRRLPRRGQPHRRLGAPRRLRRRDVRRPRGRLAAGQRDELLRRRRLPRRRLAARPQRLDDAAVADEAIHLATAEAAVRLRQTGAPVASIFGLSPHRGAGRHARRRRTVADARCDDLLGARARAVPRRRAARARARAGRAARPRRRVRPDRLLVLRGDGRRRRPRGDPSAGRAGLAARLRRSGPTGSAWCSTGCTPRCPARRCSSPSTASAPTTTSSAPRYLARGLEVIQRRDRRAASTCAASSTGPASTTTSGSTATTSRSGSSTAIATSNPSALVLQSEARP